MTLIGISSPNVEACEDPSVTLGNPSSPETLDHLASHTTGSKPNAIQNLIPDVLREIFSYCLPSDFSEPLSRVAPFNFSTVCRSWRDFVLEMPSLWASLELAIYHQRCRDEAINPGPPCTDPIHTTCSRILYAWERWLELSADYPVDINLEIVMDRAPTAIAEIIRITFQHQRRWRRYSVDCQLTTLNPVISSMDYSFDLQHHLREFNISIVNGHYQAFCGGRYRLDLLSASNITRLMIPQARTMVSQPVARMESLAELHVYEIEIAALPCILRNAPNITRIIVGLRGDINEEDISRISLNKLRTLHVYMNRDNMASLSHLLELLLAPSLKDLRFLCRHIGELPESNLWTALKEFFERSYPPIEALELNSRGGRYTSMGRLASKPSSDDALIGILAGLPGLKRLHIQGSIVSSRLFSSLARDRCEASGGILCPLLHDFPRYGDRDELDLYLDERKLTTLEE